MALDYLKALWPVALAVVGIVIWLVRLEARVKAIEIRFAEIARANSEDHKAIKDVLYQLRDVFVWKGWILPKDAKVSAEAKPGGA